MARGPRAPWRHPPRRYRHLCQTVCCAAVRCRSLRSASQGHRIGGLEEVSIPKAHPASPPLQQSGDRGGVDKHWGDSGEDGSSSLRAKLVPYGLLSSSFHIADTSYLRSQRRWEQDLGAGERAGELMQCRGKGCGMPRAGDCRSIRRYCVRKRVQLRIGVAFTGLDPVPGVVRKRCRQGSRRHRAGSATWFGRRVE